MADEAVRIERLTNVPQYHECEALQQRIWGLAEIDVVPLHLMITAQRNGGLVLGAFDDHGTMIGFLLGFLGSSGDDPVRAKHCSHMMGVLPEWRGRSIGYRLKLAQREFVCGRQGLDLVTWTYDPLESRNAALNIGKLGALCSSYLRDLYGPMKDALNAGLPTDRFRVDWWVSSRWVARRIAGEISTPSVEQLLQQRGQPLNPATIGAGGLPWPCPAVRLPDAEAVIVEIPSDIGTIKATDAALASQWREQTREVFEACFAAGYTATGFSTQRSTDDVRRSYYTLSCSFEVM